MCQSRAIHPRVLGPTVAGLALRAVAGCRQEMYDQPRYEPQEASTFFKDGKADRPLVPGTVARLDPRNEPRDEQYDRAPMVAGDLGDLTDRRMRGPGERARRDPGEQLDREATGVVDGKAVHTIPFPVDRAVLERGQQRYRIFCTPCHGAKGDGRGMIVRRGFSPPPPFYGKRPRTGESAAATFYEDLRDAPVGHFFDVITQRPRRDVLVRLAHPPPRPLGDRRLHPGPPTEPVRRGRRPPAAGPRVVVERSTP